jgi:hypothetical protein
MSNRLEERILQTKTLLKNLKQQRREEECVARAARPKKKPGRKPISREILAKAEKLADKLPLNEVALRCDVAVRTLYNKGLSRTNLNRKKTAQGNFVVCRL